MISKTETIVWSISIAAALTGLWFFQTSKNPDHIEYNDGLSDAPRASTVIQKVNIGNIFHASGYVQEKTESGSWMMFRGANRDNIVNADEKMTISDSQPREIWRVKLGEGYAAPVIYKNRVYLLDYDEKENADMLRCFDFTTGTEIWRRGYKVNIRRNHGKSRTIPAIADNAVITIGPLGHVMSVDADSGELLWSLDLSAEFGTEIPQWYAGQCGISDQNTVIIAPAGDDVLMLKLEARTGKEIWRAANSEKLKMSHSSVMKYTLDSVPTYVYCGLGGTIGVGEDGTILWSNTEWKPQVVAPSPVQLTGNRLFLCAGYGYGGAVLEIEEGSAKIISRWKGNRGLSSEQQTPIVHDGKIFSIMPKDAGGNRQLMLMADVNSDQLEILGESSRDERFGIGPYLLIGNRFFIVDDDGFLFYLDYISDKLVLNGKFKILPGHDSWGPLAYADGFLLARDTYDMVCLKLTEETSNE